MPRRIVEDIRSSDDGDLPWFIPKDVVEERRRALTPKAGPYDLKLAVVGCGMQGRKLAATAVQLRGIHIEAVCDIVPRRREKLAALVGGQGGPARSYARSEEMLERHPGLDAVIVATPDWVHRTHALAAMGVGAHVYCEAPMAHNLGHAVDIAAAANRLNRKVQVGLQRRSHPAYRVAVEEMAHEGGVLGSIQTAKAQYNRVETLGVPSRTESLEHLDDFGYETAHKFVNWRWYLRYGAGPFVERCIHQMDLFNWVFRGEPVSVVGSGGIDVLPGVEHADGGIALSTYVTEGHARRALNSMTAASSHDGAYESIQGVKGFLHFCLDEEFPVWWKREVPFRFEYTSFMRRGVVGITAWFSSDAVYGTPYLTRLDRHGLLVTDSEPISWAKGWNVIAPLGLQPHYYHLVNFFDAVQFGAALNCPPEVGLSAMRAALAAREALTSDTPIWLEARG